MHARRSFRQFASVGESQYVMKARIMCWSPWSFEPPPAFHDWFISNEDSRAVHALGKKAVYLGVPLGLLASHIFLISPLKEPEEKDYGDED